jgi:hypothetical protein
MRVFADSRIMSDSGNALVFKAGAGAMESVRKHGFAPELIGTIAGASGGAKWLALSQLDRYIVSELLPKMDAPVHLVGSSIGSWRFTCYAQSDPLAAIDRFELAYLEQSYSDAPDIHEITAKGREILDFVLRDQGIEQILNNPLVRVHILTVRARHVLASERRSLLAAGLIGAAMLNTVSRASLGLFFERALFFDTRDEPPFLGMRGFPIQRVPLTAENYVDAVAASGAIPLVLSGVRDIHGAKRGVYRDGGIIDYHLDIPQSAADRLTLYPHFFDRIVPGWFDKKMTWRRPRPANVDRTILVSPSAEFVASLPNGKIPDRTDFESFTPLQRKRNWRESIIACRRLADEFHEVIEKDQLAARLQPL